MKQSWSEFVTCFGKARTSKKLVFYNKFISSYGQEKASMIAKLEAHRFSMKKSVRHTMHCYLKPSMLPETAPTRTMRYHMVPYATITKWYQMVPNGTIWYHMVPYGTIMVPYGTIWYHMVPYGTIWYHFGTIWYHFGTMWYYTVQDFPCFIILFCLSLYVFDLFLFIFLF